MAEKKHFWRGFTLKRFLIHAGILFVLLVIWDFIFRNLPEHFSFIYLLKLIGKSLFIAFILTLWSDPAEKEDVE